MMHGFTLLMTFLARNTVLAKGTIFQISLYKSNSTILYKDFANNSQVRFPPSEASPARHRSKVGIREKISKKGSTQSNYSYSYKGQKQI